MAQKQVQIKDGHVYFPNPDGVFDLLNDGVLLHTELIVEGEPRQGQASQPSCSGIYAQPSRSSLVRRPLFPQLRRITSFHVAVM